MAIKSFSLLVFSALLTFATFTVASLANSFSAHQLHSRQNTSNFVPTGPFLGDFPDPSTINVNGTWFAYSSSTVTPNINVPMATSPDLRSWNRLTYPANEAMVEVDALPSLPGWVNKTAGGVWAPDVAEWRPGLFTLLFSAVPLSSYRQHCIGLAQSSSPTGPFVSYSPSPLVCPIAEGGAIDASHFRDPETGNFFILYKVDGGSNNANIDGHICGNTPDSPPSSTPLMLQQIGDPDWFDFMGEPKKLLDNMGHSDEGDVEAPSLIYIPIPNDKARPKKRDVTLVTDVVYGTITECPETKTSIELSASTSEFTPYTNISATVTNSDSMVTIITPSSSAASLSASLSQSPSGYIPSEGPGSPSPPNTTANGIHVLFFSPGCFADTSYAVAYAVSTNGVAGPYIRQPDLLQSGDGGLVSPGGLTAVGLDPSTREMATGGTVTGEHGFAVYHAGVPSPAGERSMYSAMLAWNGTGIVLLNP